MKIAVILRTAGQPDAEVGKAAADTWPEAQRELPALLRRLADEIEHHTVDEQEVTDAAP